MGDERAGTVEQATVEQATVGGGAIHRDVNPPPHLVPATTKALQDHLRDEMQYPCSAWGYPPWGGGA